MEEQIERKRKEIEGVKKMKEKVEETLRGFEDKAPQKTAVETDGEEPETAADVRRVEAQRHMWNAMDEILGH